MKQCQICAKNNKEVDWKNKELLNKFLSQEFKILRPRATGTCSKHQRQVARAIKRARTMGILPYTPMIYK